MPNSPSSGTGRGAIIDDPANDLYLVSGLHDLSKTAIGKLLAISTMTGTLCKQLCLMLHKVLEYYHWRKSIERRNNNDNKLSISDADADLFRCCGLADLPLESLRHLEWLCTMESLENEVRLMFQKMLVYYSWRKNKECRVDLRKNLPKLNHLWVASPLTTGPASVTAVAPTSPCHPVDDTPPEDPR